MDDVSFSIEHGEIVGLLGHNGAGKTTIMKMLTGYLEPSSGSIEVDGVNIAESPGVVQARLGYLPENLPLYPEMSVLDYLEYTAELRGVPEAERGQALRRTIEATELGERALDPIHTLSRGYRQRVGVAQAILHRPRFLILDEPTNGLDPAQTQQMRELIVRLAEHATVILSTHIMQEVSAVCDRVMILRNGALVLDDRLQNLQRSVRVTVVTDADAAAVNASLEGVAGVGPAELVGEVDGRRRVALPLTTDDALNVSAEVAGRLIGVGAKLFSIAPEQRDLESVFREVSEL